jgi:hypothetical protein
MAITELHIDIRDVCEQRRQSQQAQPQVRVCARARNDCNAHLGALCSGEAPLHKAVMNGFVRLILVRLLLSHGVDVNALNKWVSLASPVRDWFEC